MSRKHPAAYFDPLDWNFDEVPDNELVACCYWEYARESDFIRSTLKKYRDWFLAGGNWDNGGWEIGDDLERIQSCGYVSEVFMRGCAFGPTAHHQSKDPGKANYRHPQAAQITGSFPAPWQSLSTAERNERGHIRTERTLLSLVPIKRGTWHDAKDIASWAEGRWRAWNAAYQATRQEYPGISEEDLVKQGKLNASPGIQPSLYRAGDEVTVISIHWSDFTNEELVHYFRRWVRANRPKQLDDPDARGHKPKDWRAQLTRLAVMRLLSRFTALELVADNGFPAIWNTKQFSGRKWADVSKWYAARSEACSAFQKFFPFLPRKEMPLSWKRPVPAK